jgi:hypothetical protein
MSLIMIPSKLKASSFHSQFPVVLISYEAGLGRGIVLAPCRTR